jgi:hypothetical protein
VDYKTQRSIVIAASVSVFDDGDMIDREQVNRPASAHVSHPPFKWLAWMIVGAAGVASIGGLTLSDAPAILAKLVVATALSVAVVTVVYFLTRPRRK